MKDNLPTSENNKPVTGFIIGRFQPLHIGHIYMIRESLKHVDTLLVFIGSANEQGTKRNPLDYTTRESILMRALQAEFESELNSNRIIVKPLNDLKGESNNHPSWGDYLMENVLKHIDTPKYYFTGAEAMRTNWFENGKYDYLEFICVSKDVAKISSTEVRELIINNGEYTHLSPYITNEDAMSLKSTLSNLI